MTPFLPLYRSVRTGEFVRAGRIKRRTACRLELSQSKFGTLASSASGAPLVPWELPESWFAANTWRPGDWLVLERVPRVLSETEFPEQFVFERGAEPPRGFERPERDRPERRALA